MREQNGVHTCDKRRTRSEIHAAFPEYYFEEGFTERDELWKPDYREKYEDIDQRARHVLGMIFKNDTEQCKRCLFLEGSRLGGEKLTRGSTSYIYYSAWRVYRRLPARVSASPLDSSYRRFVPELVRASSRVAQVVVLIVRDSTGGRERVRYRRAVA